MSDCALPPAARKGPRAAKFLQAGTTVAYAALRRRALDPCVRAGQTRKAGKTAMTKGEEGE
jgi:hypothetical protein